MSTGQGMEVSVVMESWTVGAQYQPRLLEWHPLMDEDSAEADDHETAKSAGTGTP